MIKKRYNKKDTKRRYKNKYAQKPKVQIVQKIRDFALGRSFPPQMEMKCHFNELYQLDQNTIGGWASVQYRLNSVYDPNYTTAIVDNSATPHVTMSKIYQKYEVKAVHIKVTMAP